MAWISRLRVPPSHMKAISPSRQSRVLVSGTVSWKVIAPITLALLFELACSLAHAQNVITTISTGPSPFAVAVDEVTNRIYVSHGNDVSVIDGQTNTIVSIAVGANAGPIAVNTVTNKIFVACGSGVTVIDGVSNAVTTIPTTETNPDSIAVNPVTNKIYVADSNNFINGSVLEIDGATNAVTTVAKGFLVGPIAVNPVTNQIYVCGNILGGEATVIDGATHETESVGANNSPGGPSGPIAFNPDAIVVNTDTNEIYVGNQNPSDVTLIEGATNDVSNVGLSDAVIAMALNMETNKIYAVSQGTSGIMVIDGSTNSATLLDTGANSDGIAVDSVTNKIYVVQVSTNGTLSIVDGVTNAIFKIPIGVYPFAVSVNSMTNRIYVLDNDSNGTLTVIDGTPLTAAPSFTTNPVSQTTNVGASVVFNAVATGMPSPTYEWSFNGAPLSDGGNLSGSSTPVLFFNRGVSAANAGTYMCTATNGSGSATSALASLSVTDTATPGRLVNLSSRAYTGTSSANILIAGFAVSGNTTNTLILRGVGPTLANFNVPGFAVTPTLALYDTASPNANLITQNSGWQTPPSLAVGVWEGKAAAVEATEADFSQVGAFALATGSGDSAVKIGLPAGAYTSQIIGTGDSGIALAEVYLVGTGNPAAQLINISARAYVVHEQSILIAGFVISGTTSETVLIRASGPALAQFGVLSPLPDPEIQLFDSNQNLISSNVGWQGSPQIASAASTVGAFRWSDPSSADSAVMVTLPPGGYTAQLSPLTGDQGTALVEVYAVP